MSKKIFKGVILLWVMLFPLLAFSQSKKPTIMVVPSDNYCIQHGFTTVFNSQGTKEVLPDYKKAVQNDADLNVAISIIGQMMADRGFPTKLLEQEIKSLSQDADEEAMMTSKSGGEIAESPVDKLKKVAKSDIIIQVNWTINKLGSQRSLTLNLQGIDAYTNKQIAAGVGTGEPTYSAELPILIEEAIANHLDNFNRQLQNHFNYMLENGREVSLRVYCWDNSTIDLESEVHGEELSFLIEEWVNQHTVKKSFNLSDATENMMRFEQVRIPLYDANNNGVDTRKWARGLVQYLKSLGVQSKLTVKGLGQATIIIGGK